MYTLLPSDVSAIVPSLFRNDLNSKFCANGSAPIALSRSASENAARPPSTCNAPSSLKVESVSFPQKDQNNVDVEFSTKSYFDSVSNFSYNSEAKSETLRCHLIGMKLKCLTYLLYM